MSPREYGFTLLEVAIAGSIMVIGIIMAAQITRTTLESTNPNTGKTPNQAAVVEQFLRAQVAAIKGNKQNPGTAIASMPVGTGSLYPTVTINLPNQKTGPGLLVGNGGVTYTLDEYDVTIQMTMANDRTKAPATDPIVAKTKFWKLGVSLGASKAGI